MGFNQYNLGQHLPCQVSCITEASGSEEDFNFFVYFFGSNPEFLFLALVAILFIEAEPF